MNTPIWLQEYWPLLLAVGGGLTFLKEIRAYALGLFGACVSVFTARVTLSIRTGSSLISQHAVLTPATYRSTALLAQSESGFMSYDDETPDDAMLTPGWAVCRIPDKAGRVLLWHLSLKESPAGGNRPILYSYEAKTFSWKPRGVQVSHLLREAKTDKVCVMYGYHAISREPFKGMPTPEQLDFVKLIEAAAKNKAKCVVGLFGEPGGGKTTAVLLAAQRLGSRIHYIDLANTDKHALLHKVAQASRSDDLLLIEDIDAHTASHTRQAEEKGDDLAVKSSGSERIDLAFLLNLLDGVLSANVRCVLTSNHPERLDAALLRPGRIDSRFDNFGGKTKREVVE